MNRQVAINTIFDTWWKRDSEFCCSNGERAASRMELKECLLALGITKEEMEIHFERRLAGHDDGDG